MVFSVNFFYHNTIFPVSQASILFQSLPLFALFLILLTKTGTYFRTRFSTILKIPYNTIAMTHRIKIAMIRRVN